MTPKYCVNKPHTLKIQGFINKIQNLYIAENINTYKWSM